MPTVYTPPTISYAWPTSDRLTSRLKIPRGRAIITDGAGGWRSNEVPFQGELEALTEGVDYFMGGHEYLIDCPTALSLYTAGFFPGYPQSSCAVSAGLFPSSLTFPSSATIPGGL